MTHQTSNLLNASELLDIYGTPALNDKERLEAFSLTPEELTCFKKFRNPTDAIYFALILAFFKMKQTFVEIIPDSHDWKHLAERYFPDTCVPKQLPKHAQEFRIKNMVLELCGYQRLNRNLQTELITELSNRVASCPRQRQVCKELLNLCYKQRIAIPGYTTLQNMVSCAWNKEVNRLGKAYHRHTSRQERKEILSLLEKIEGAHPIMKLKQDMKTFRTHDIWEEIDKLKGLSDLFEVSRRVLESLQLPKATITYYSELVSYYNGTRLNQLNGHMVGIYLLSYVNIRYQQLNDNLLDAFKKRTQSIQIKALDYAKSEALKHIDRMKTLREQVSQVLLTVVNYPDPELVPKATLYKELPEGDFLTAALLLVDEKMDKDILFWQYIDLTKGSIKLNLRCLFEAIRFDSDSHEALQEAISYLKQSFKQNKIPPLPTRLKQWVGATHEKHFFKGNEIILNRFEFFVYRKIVHHLNANNLSIKNSLRYKKVEDELYGARKWRREKRKILNKMDYPQLLKPIKQLLREKKTSLTRLYRVLNASIQSGENTAIKIKRNNSGKIVWSLRPFEALYEDDNDHILSSLPKQGIVSIIQFVENMVGFSKAFDPILPRGTRNKKDFQLIMAAVLANAIRIGTRQMAATSNLSESPLLTAEGSYVRTETLQKAIDMVNNAVAELPIFREWYINNIPHASLDGMKIETSFKNIKARGSSKYFPLGTGVSAYNEILNGLSMAGKLIGSHEYEGHHTFEMVTTQSGSTIRPHHISTDKHGMNAFNFALFDFIDMIFCPRIPKIHKETLWGFGKAEDYKGFMIKPTQFVDESLIVEEWDNIQRITSSLLSGEAPPSSIIKKLSAKEYSSKTKKAFVGYNHIVRSQFILQYLHEEDFRRAVETALNRGEGYNNLYRSITLLNEGQLKGKTEIEMNVWHHCTRLIAACIHYFNSHILNELYTNAVTKQQKRFIIKFSPTAWSHANLLGHYTFHQRSQNDWLKAWIQNFDYKLSQGVENKKTKS